MIARFWRGGSTRAHVDAYEALHRTTICLGIRQRQIVGFRGIELLRRPAGTDVEFATIMWFDSLQAVDALAGVDCDIAVVPAPPARSSPIRRALGPLRGPGTAERHPSGRSCRGAQRADGRPTLLA